MNTFEELSEIKKGIISYNEGPKLVLAGPGSGKTRVITENIKFLLNDNKENFHILALTFTNKAANEMKDRLSSLRHIKSRIYIGTIHSFCLNVLKSKGQRIGLQKEIILYDEYSSKQIFEKIVLNRKIILNKDNLFSLIKNIKKKIITLDEIDEKFKLEVELVLDLYNKELKINSALDYYDLIEYTTHLFRTDPIIRRFFNKLYKYVFIDEGQDLNINQYELITAFCPPNEIPLITMVGDSNQAIFGWNGASSEFLILFRQNYSAESFYLNENFRNCKQIMELAIKLKPNEKYLCQRIMNGKVEIIKSINEEIEIQFVTNKIKKILINNEINPEDIGIIIRTKYSPKVENLEDALIENKIKFKKIFNRRKFEFKSEFFKTFEILLRKYQNPFDSLFEHQIIERNVDVKLIRIFENFFNTIFIKPSKFSQILKSIINNVLSLQLFIYEMDLINQDFITINNLWINFIKTIRDEERNPNNFLNYLALGDVYDSENNSISILNTNTAKGTEFKVIFIMGFTDGNFPYYKAKLKGDLEEELNNIFVAVTRAKNELYFTSHLYTVNVYGKLIKTSESPYYNKMELFKCKNIFLKSPEEIYTFL